MSKITDNKQVYSEFKYFKDIYTSLNKAPEIEFISKNGEESIHLIGGDDSSYFILIGKLYGETAFLSWLTSSDCIVHAKLEDINKLAKCLKKNTISYEATEVSFIYEMLDKDGNTQTITFIKKMYVPEEKINFIQSKLAYSAKIPTEYLSHDICTISLNNDNKITNDENDRKILEIPSKKVLASLKDGEYDILYSDFIENRRYVAIRCKNKQLMLEQIFATI